MWYFFSQDSYRKVDVISKAEFDCQRGLEDLDLEGDGDLVFGPLDQDEATSPTNSSKSDQPIKRPEHRGRACDSEGLEEMSHSKVSSPSTGSPHARQRRKRSEKRARFYPVLNKQKSPGKMVDLAILVVSANLNPCSL